MDSEQSLVQIAERALADAEEAYRFDPSDANQRSVWKAWSFVRNAREPDRQEKTRSARPPTASED
jgi:hypothetical protein